MKELVFPAAAMATAFLVFVPLFTFASRAGLSHLQRSGSWASFGSATTFALLITATLLPLLWLISSTLHQLEPGQGVASCLLDHGGRRCVDTQLLLAALVAGGAGLVGFHLWRYRSPAIPRRLPENDARVRKVRRIARSHRHLARLRIVVVCESPTPLYTSGLLSPTVVVDACFARLSDRQVLRAALLHEHAHVAGRDALRYFIVRSCLALNPLRRLLQPDFDRWRVAREAACDSDAVSRGGDPLALALGILRAARFRCGRLGPPVVGLCGHGRALKLRLALLMDETPTANPTRGRLLLFASALAALAVPHVPELEVLDHLHLTVEHLLRGS